LKGQRTTQIALDAGSGSDYALGALYSSYNRPGWSAEKIARHAIETAAEFDDGTGMPVHSHHLKLRN